MRYLILFVFLLAGKFGLAQTPADSLYRVDSLAKRDSLLTDTAVVQTPLRKDTIQLFLAHPFTSDSFLYRERLFFRFTNPVRYTISQKKWEGKEAIFYTIIGLLLFFALIKNAFSRYLKDLYSSYFRTTVRQKQIKEQLLQNPLPSLLFNIFFIVSTGVFLGLLFEHFGFGGEQPFWMLAAYSALALTLIYGGKFVVLKFFGWVFQLSDAADTYIFVVFSTNKMIGIILLPFTISMAFTNGALNAATVTLSLIVLGLLFLYRYFLAFASINRSAHISALHFLIYLVAFEVLPLLLINKLLFAFLRELS